MKILISIIIFLNIAVSDELITECNQTNNASGRYLLSWNSSWDKPLKKDVLRSSSWYDYLSCKYKFDYPNEHKKHGAVDIIANIGDEVYSIANGNVIYVIKNYHSTLNMSAVFVKYKLDDNSEIIVLYGHVYPLVEEGENIYKGQKIGEMRLFGDPRHIHFTITKNLEYHIDIKEGKNGKKDQFGSAYSDMVEPISFLHEHKPYEYENMCFPDSYEAQEFQRESICKLKDEGIVKGKADGKYHPNDTVTRAEFTKIILLSKYSQSEIDKAESTNFSDINDWYKNYINFAKNKGIIDGYEDQTFKPNEPINFAEVSKIIVNTFLKYCPLEDNTSTTEWFEKFTSILEKNYSLKFNPSHNVTRAEMAHIISKVKGL
jgi:murein DD-endopeptidase MepM/ murein hydrolase activator NlpD